MNTAAKGAVERRHQRASCDAPAEFSWGTITHPATVMVVSMGGCFLRTGVFVPLGEELELTFCLESGPDPIRCRAKVVWLAGRGIRIRGQTCRGFALEFMRIFPEDRSRIDEYVRRQTRVFRHLERELAKAHPDRELIKDLYSKVRPGDSLHLGHIRKICAEEIRYFRLRK
mgnify:CR=1 FL=1